MLALTLLGASAAPLPAQPARAGEEIVIIGQRQRIEVRAERALSPEDVAAYGLGTIGELLDEIDAEQGDINDDPLFLVDGRRVATLGDIAEYPTEAVARIDILPIGTATRVGASANRRVYNVVLKAQARAIIGRVVVGAATEGNWGSRTADLSVTQIRRPRRLNMTVRIRDEDALRESARGIVQPAGLPANLGRHRTLRPSLGGLEVRISAADQLAPWLDGSVTATLTDNRRLSLLGLAGDGQTLEQRTRTRTANMDLQLNGEVGDWQLAFTGTYNEDRRRTATDRPLADGALQTERAQIVARTRSAAAELVASGPVLDLPAGELRATLGAALSRDRICGGRRLDASFTSNCYAQSSRDLTAAIDVPIASRGAGIFRPLGELSANFQLQRSRVTGLGTLINHTYALTWAPAEWMRLFGSMTSGRTPPAVGLLAEPLLETPGVRYFDPLLGETVDILQISGGNPEIRAQRGRNDRVHLTIKPLRSVALNVTAEYMRVRNRDLVTALPKASELILRVFPERFVRDANGILTRVDVRPVSVARQSEEQLRYALNLSLPLGRDGDGGSADTSEGDQAPRGRSRLQFNAAHTIILSSELLIRPGFDPIDLLSRDAIGLSGASRPRHQVDVTVGYAERGFGLRLAGQYRSTSYLNLVSGTSADMLRFSPLTTFSLRAFADGARLLPSAGWLKGARLSLSFLNITNDRQKVRDARGTTPLAYQPAYLDPAGRTVQVELRKSF